MIRREPFVTDRAALLKTDTCRISTLPYNITFQGEEYVPGMLFGADINDTSPTTFNIVDTYCNAINDQPLRSFIEVFYMVKFPDRRIYTEFQGEGVLTNFNPRGVWVDPYEDIIWITDFSRGMVYAYNYYNLQVIHSRTFRVPGASTFTVGIVGDKDTLFISDIQHDKIWAVDKYTGLAKPDLEFNTLAATNVNQPEGLALTDEHIYVVNSLNDIVYCFDRVTKQPVPSRYIFLSHDGAARGIDIYDGKIYISDLNEDALLVYDFDTLNRLENEDIDLIDVNGDPIGISNAEGIMYVADWVDDIVYPYDLSTGLPFNSDWQVWNSYLRILTRPSATGGSSRWELDIPESALFASEQEKWSPGYGKSKYGEDFTYWDNVGEVEGNIINLRMD